MRKRLAIFGMLLVVLCANCRADQIQAKKNNKQPSAPVPAGAQQRPNTATTQAENQQDIHAEVKIVNPPKKDFYDKAPVWINLAFVIVALGTGVVICWQAIETRAAAKGAKDAAKAALDQISMMKEKERARLSVKPPPSLPAFDVRQRSWGLMISLPVKNDGPTQAVNIAGIAAAIASDNSSFPNGDQDFVSLPTEIGGGEGFPVAVPLSHRFIGRAVPEHFYVHVWGSVAYRDIFDEKKTHSAPFGFRCEMKQIRGDGMAIQDGEWWDWGHPDQEKAT